MSSDLRDLTQRYEELRAARAFTDYAVAKALRLPPSQFPELFKKAAVDAMDAADSSALIRRGSMAFVDLMELEALIGKTRGAWVPAPPFANVVDETSEPDVQWTAAGNPVPLVRLNFDSATMEATSFSVIVALSKELLKTADPRARTMIERRLLRALRRAEDRRLLSTDAAIAGERPAGLLHGVSATGSGSPQSMTDDLEALWSAVSEGDADRPFFICSPRGGMYLHSLHEDGSARFPDAGPRGGNIAGVPLLTSRAAADLLVLLDAAHLAVADEGAETSASENAAVAMSDSPTSPSTVVSGFQTNTVFVKLERRIYWTLTTGDAIGFIQLPIGGSPA
jgi:hypothetical protein